MARRNKKLHHRIHRHINRRWRRYGYKHTTVAIVLITLFILALDSAIISTVLDSITSLGRAGIVLAGMLFVSLFTAAPAVVLLLEFGEIFSPLTIAFYGALGSAVGDLIILKIFEDRIAHELKPLVTKMKLTPWLRAIRRKKNRERATLAGMVAIASPLPDEIGIGLLGIAHLPTISLLVITFLLNAAGILVLVVVA